MNVKLLRNLTAFVVLLVAPACSSSKNPIQPSFTSTTVAEAAPGVSVTLSNLNGTYMGLASEICQASDAEIAPVAIDNLSVDFAVSGASLAGALLFSCDTDNCENGSVLGAITACPIPPDPCAVGIKKALSGSTAPACLTGDPWDSGSLQVFAARPLDAPNTWNVMALIETSGDHSNMVSATVGQPAGVTASSDSSMSSARFARRLRTVHRVHR
jgi:hypothetical protein